MDRYKCRFCFKSFINGRALGGHMRSHMLSLSPKRELYEEGEEEPIQLGDDVTDSEDASSSSDEDGESETESSRIVVNSTKRRSKRTRKLGSFDFEFKKLKTSELGESMAETEHQSSASDTTTEEDLAFCLIMLSRDKWKQQNNKKKKKQTGEEDDDEEDYKSSKNRGGRGRFKCETCGKVFKSYQALGGHRASHKKNKTCSTTTMVIKTEHGKTEYDNGVRVHECPICFRVFSSGQALGGHKRSHGSSNSNNNMGAGRGLLLSVNQIVKEEEEVKQRMIDLNLPAPNEDDETTSVVVDEW